MGSQTARSEKSTGLNAAVLRASFDAVGLHADRLSKRFYEQLFADYPHLRGLFGKTNMAEQRKKLVQSLAMIVHWVEQPDRMSQYLTKLGERHVEYGVRQADYEPVGLTLLKVLAEIAGPDVWTAEIESAWTNAINAIAGVMLGGTTNPSHGELARTSKVEEQDRFASATGDQPAPRRTNSKKIFPKASSSNTRAALPASTKDLPMSHGSTIQSGGIAEAEPTLEFDQLFGMVDFAPLTTFFVDNAGNVLYLNQKGYEVFRSLETALGFAPEEFVAGPISRVYEILPELQKAAKGLASQKKVRIKLGAHLIDVYLIPLSDKGGKRIGLFQGWDVVTGAWRRRRRRASQTHCWRICRST